MNIKPFKLLFRDLPIFSFLPVLQKDQWTISYPNLPIFSKAVLAPKKYVCAKRWQTWWTAPGLKRGHLEPFLRYVPMRRAPRLISFAGEHGSPKTERCRPTSDSEICLYRRFECVIHIRDPGDFGGGLSSTARPCHRITGRPPREPSTRKITALIMLSTLNVAAS